MEKKLTQEALAEKQMTICGRNSALKESSSMLQEMLIMTI